MHPHPSPQRLMTARELRAVRRYTAVVVDERQQLRKVERLGR